MITKFKWFYSMIAVMLYFVFLVVKNIYYSFNTYTYQSIMAKVELKTK